MKKLAIFLLLISSPAWAGWKSIGEDAAGTSYADTATIVKSGTTAKIWSMLDYKAFQRMVEVGYFSQKTQVEYDCKDKMAIHLAPQSLGSGAAGAGLVCCL